MAASPGTDTASRYGPGMWAGSLPDMMRERVRSILFVSTLYESFILAEDGLLNELMQTKYLDLHLVQAPSLTQVSTGTDALGLIGAGHTFDLVIAGVHVGDMDAVQLARALRRIAPNMPVVLLAHDYPALKSFRLRRDARELAGLFLWEGDARLLVAMAKLIEDRRNVDRDARVGVPIFLVIEDNIRNYSSFLPVIYTEVMRHVERVTAEGVSLSQRMLRFRGRPKILLATTFEEAWDLFQSYRDNVLGVISDVEFPRGAASDPQAGVELTRRIRQLRPDMPIALHSTHPGNEAMARELGCAFLWKRSNDLLHQLRRQLAELFCFGPFLFRAPDGRELDQAHDLDTLVAGIRRIPVEALAGHAERNDFSRWLSVRAEFELAQLLRPRQVADYGSYEAMRDDLVRTIEEFRQQRLRGMVVDFDAARFASTDGVSRIGSGSLGGKARSIAFAARLLDRSGLRDRFAGVRIAVPPSAVLGTDVFDAFLARNDLRPVALESGDDAERERRFVAGSLPDDACDALARLVATADFPLAVRSSSLLEDSPFQPFAGVFETLMLPNSDPDPARRLAALHAAIAKVYASTFSSRLRSVIHATPYRLEELKMAVVIQKVVGRRRGNLFYPDFAGVARSLDFYPAPPAQPHDGTVSVALGFGKTVVEGGRCLRFSPAYPDRPIGLATVATALDTAQREFWALPMDGPEPDRLVSCGLEVAEADGLLGLLGSTYSPDSDVLTDGLSRDGVRIVSFAGVLKHERFPLAGIVRELLAIFERGVGGPIEIEFAVDTSGPPGTAAEFAFLQLRPLAPAREPENIELGDLPRDSLICSSTAVLGSGRIDGIRDIVTIERGYRASLAPALTRRLARLNAELLQRGDPYLLIGPGRWGSSHPQLGIPVTWEDIAGARVVVETTLGDGAVAPSQGSHFLQNLAAAGTGYFTVDEQAADGFLDWDWLESQRPLSTAAGIRHLRLDRPITVVINGVAREGVITKPIASQPPH